MATTHQIDLQKFHLYACLPFVEIADESVIEFGPVIFFPASKLNHFFPSYSDVFSDYMGIVGQIKACTNEQENAFVKTGTLSLKGMTCVAMQEGVPKELEEFLLIDALYLLYFACTFRSLYYGQEIPPFNPFRKIIPASKEFVTNKQNWESLYINEIDREEGICLHIIDPDICHALGKALEAIYLQTPEMEFVKIYKRLVRSIRYLVDRFFQRFVNLFKKEISFPQQIFEPEDLIFLASSFESLFNVNNQQDVVANFKHTLRPLLHLKYSRPVEIFWKWVDDFYEAKSLIIQGETFLNPLFRVNPNFEVPHIFLGIKLFVYSVYYYLFKYQLLLSTHDDPYTPPDFKWIHPEEILLFFWTEPAVLEKIDLFIKQSTQDPLKEEALADLNLLTTLFVSLYDRYYLSEQLAGEGFIRFIPSPVMELTKHGYSILGQLNEIKFKTPQNKLLDFIHPYFANVLQDRLNEKKLEKKD